MSNESINADFLNSLDRFFADTITHRLVAAASEIDLDDTLWAAFEGMDLWGVGIDEEAGGAGGGLPEVVALMQAAGRHAVPMPLAEHHVATLCLATQHGAIPDGLSVFTPGTREDSARLDGERVHGTLHQVGWGRSARRIVAVVTDHDGIPQVVEVDAKQARIRRGADFAGQPRDSLEFEGATCQVVGDATVAAVLRRRAVLLRSALMVGAMESVARMTRDYVHQREQFGVTIGSFQSVQQHVVKVQQSATMTALCLARATAATESGAGAFEVHALRVLSGENAATSIRSAHQAHGAIGMTQEFGLQHLTRRLNTWRWDFDAFSRGARAIGLLAMEAGSLSSLITTPPTQVSTPELSLRKAT